MAGGHTTSSDTMSGLCAPASAGLSRLFSRYAHAVTPLAFASIEGTVGGCDQVRGLTHAAIVDRDAEASGQVVVLTAGLVGGQLDLITQTLCQAHRTLEWSV